MTNPIFLPSRRRFLGELAVGGTAFLTPGAFAEELQQVRTAAQTEWPFYPDRLPLDTDNDLLIVNDAINPAVGEVTHLTGRVLDSKGSPVRNAVVEIWQVDNNGIYVHSESPNRDNLDGNFQGFGRFLTGRSGEYYFRTIKPVPYTAGNLPRTPHIHFKILKGDRNFLTTQLYIKGERLNEQDRILNAIRDQTERQSLIVPFTPVKESRLGELAATFDIVLGATPEG